MAEDRNDYYRDHPEDRNNRDRDAYLDNRTGVGPSRGSGYRASYDQNSQRESRSFRPGRDYGLGGGYRAYPEGRGEDRGDYSRSDDDYRGADSAYGFNPGPGNDLGGGFDPYMAAGGYQPPMQNPPEPSRPRGQQQHRGFWDRAGDTVASWMGDDEARRRHATDMQTRSHQGRGPKAYKRSDARIHEDVNDRLTDDPWIDATHIDVKVSETEVTLSGTVVSRDDKRHAERIADHVSGVTHVQNNLRVDANQATGDNTVLNPTLDKQADGRTNAN